ncbi:hypothetical protein VNI00_003025 [Paramarasmius palmivorus]|uniref:F-box domain-containing protein n=1 Tax=Paramarasmius palmivorus TaxID=297713 RepID=A0AAW0DXZ2_9AGAR
MGAAVYSHTSANARTFLPSVGFSLTNAEPLEGNLQRASDAPQFARKTQHPIHKLPNEMLREIVSEWHHLDSQRDLLKITPNQSFRPRKKFVDSLDTTRALWACAQVSHSWRQTSLSFASWWTNIRILMPDPSTSEGKKLAMVHNLTSVLHWTKDVPIAVEIKSFHSFGPDDPLFATICSHSFRWEKLRLVLCFEEIDVLPAMLLPVKVNLHILHSLSLNLWTEPPPNIILDTFEEAPNLKNIGIVGVDDTRRFLRVPWSKIAEFDRQQGDLRIPTIIPASMDHLERMVNVVRYYDGQFHCPPGPTIELPSLQTLHVHPDRYPVEPTHWERFQMGDRFTEFRNSALKTDSTSVDMLALFLLRWGSTLQILHLDSVVVPESKFIRVSRSLTSVRSFSYIYRWSSKSKLIVALANPRFLPQLEDLAFSGFLVFFGKVLVEMLSARTLQGNGGLKRFGLPLSCVKFFKKDLERFWAAGLEVKSTGHNNTSAHWPYFQEMEG